ncbi:MAG: Nucleolar protein 16 [Sclerophora amabilis]|nr:MAG: Nucleolar protein 16 [Sclerophora amabilis]
MGRELQKKKNRSSVNKVRHKPKSKKVHIKSNPIIAANWNSSETLTQNYRRLGLTARLNAPTGGSEKRASKTASKPSASTDSLAINSSTPKSLIPTEARVERDAAGNIVRVIHSASSKRSNPLNDPLNELSESESEDRSQSRTLNQTDVVAQLEEESKLVAPKKILKQSRREGEWVERLLEKHGENYGAMFWDRKLNPMQQSKGDIRRRVRRWRETKHLHGGEKESIGDGIADEGYRG